jgi:hypothetical protein
VLAVFYLYSGGIKVVQSPERLRPMMAWVDAVPLGLVRTVGILECLGAIGLIVPPLVDVAAYLALAAAVGLVALQVGGITLHLRRRETGAIGLNIVLLVLAAVAVCLATIWF